MKNLVLAFSLLTAASTTTALAQDSLRIRCEDGMDGNAIHVQFDSTVPSLVATGRTRQEYMSPDLICGSAKVDFARDCTGEVAGGGREVGFIFSCRGDIEGQVIFGEDLSLTFYCDGPGISGPLRAAHFGGCRIVE